MEKRLAYFCSSRSWGGLEMNHLRNAAWMQERGHRVIVLGIEHSPIHAHAIEFSLPFHPIQAHRRWYDFKAVKRLKAIIETEKITHFLVRSAGDQSIAAGIKSSCKEQLHVSYFMEMQLGIRKKSIFHTIRYRRIDLWSCPLNWLKDQVEQQTTFRNKLVVIPSGVDLKRFIQTDSRADSRKKLDLSPDALIFGMVGRFDRKKGQLLLLQALTKCTNAHFHVLFMGETTHNEGSEYMNEIRSFIAEHQLEQRVIFRPYDREIAHFYRSINWMVMASDAETVGMVTIESLACGTPVLGSNAGGTPEILEGGRGGMLFETKNADDLANKIDHICTTNLHVEESILKKLAQRFDHINVCEAVESVLSLEATHDI